MNIKFCNFKLYLLGFGWLTVTINEVIAKTKYNSTELCDGNLFFIYGKAVPCDPFVTIDINGTRVFRTSTINLTTEDEFKAHYFETYKSEKIDKKLNVTIQVFDYDRRFWGKDDLVLTFNLDTTTYDTEYKDGEDSISLISFWQDERGTTISNR